jgi:hypothetical protein
LRAYGYLELDKNQNTGFEPEVYEFTILCTSSNFFKIDVLKKHV